MANTQPQPGAERILAEAYLLELGHKEDGPGDRRVHEEDHGVACGEAPDGEQAHRQYRRAGTQFPTWHTNGRGTEQLSHTFALIDLLLYGRQEEWQDSPEGWPQSPAYSRWGSSQDIAAAYGPDA